MAQSTAKLPTFGKMNIGPAAGALIAGIEFEVVRFEIDVVQQIAIVVKDYDGFAAPDRGVRSA